MHEKLLSRLATKIINYEKKEMILLKNEEKDRHKVQKVCHICKKVFSTDYNNKRYHKVKIIVVILENTEVLLKISAI